MSISAENIADSLKISMALGPAPLSFLGVGLDDWMYIVSITAGFFLILERAPKVLAAWKAMFKGKSYGDVIDQG